MRAATDAIVRAVLRAADPAAAVERCWPHEINRADRITLLASGKASAAMVEAAAPRLRGKPVDGAVTCVPEHEARVRRALESAGMPGVVVLPADHPLATERNLAAAAAVARAASTRGNDGQVLALVSGGASAHLTWPAEGIGLDGLRAVTSHLLRSGATIRELNAVRKHAERLKGGRLARLCHPSPVTALVLSDVLGDPLDVIGSGPFAPDPTTFAEALRVLHEHNAAAVSPALTARLEAGAAGGIDETPKPGDAEFERVRHLVIASNRTAVEAAIGACERQGFRVAHSRHAVDGEARQVAAAFAGTLCAAAESHTVPVAVVWGCETTVTVGDATGLGGRNTEAALACALDIAGRPGMVVLALATDGADGPTDAAGAVVTGGTVRKLARASVDAARALAQHDSYTALCAVDAVIRTGPTGTNVNDVLVGLAWQAGPPPAA